MELKDSGNRREFETGAVRDMAEGKGRCDLMPLDVVAEFLNDDIMEKLGKWQQTQDTDFLYLALERFAVFQNSFEDWKTSQIEADMILEVSHHYEDGAKKYGENNWQKGLPVNCYLDSAVRHYLKYIRGDRDEPHDRAFVWNILCMIWTIRHLSQKGE